MSVPFRRVGWAASSNIYEVNLRQYTPEGSFAAFGRELPRLRDMGIEILWFMPIHPISLKERKGDLGSYYACSDYLATNPEFGSIEDFRQLVVTAHGLGFKVIIDWVGNHTGWDHVWTASHPEFFRKNQDGQFFDIHGWEDVIDLNYDNKELWTKMIEAMRFWIRECDIDGFRCDMAMLVPIAFWREARTQLDREKELFWLAECEEIAYHEVFDATYSWKLLHKMEAVWRKESGLDGLDEVLDYYTQMFPTDAIRALFTTNHDENSHSGSEYERLGDLALAFSVLCCTWGGMPLLYSGQELPNKKRLRFFEKDQIDWNGTYALADLYKKLLGLRDRNAALRGGDPAATVRRLKTGIDGRCFAYVRENGAAAVAVVLNISGDTVGVAPWEAGLAGNWSELFSGAVVEHGGRMTLPPWGYIVLEKR